MHLVESTRILFVSVSPVSSLYPETINLIGRGKALRETCTPSLTILIFGPGVNTFQWGRWKSIGVMSIPFVDSTE